MNARVMKVDSSSFFEHLEMVREKDDKGAVVISTTIQDIHKDEMGHISSGLYYTLLDATLGTAVLGLVGGIPSTIDMYVQVFKQEQIEKLTCRGYHIQMAGTTGSGRGDIFDESGNLIASGMATFKVRKETR
ncbi:PaaI family thioesterase [Psychrobacillus sp. NPDC096426]|uniref:PaaI family thioesterase n=1 Tax=Psychrobacillus sp. NPDC096426 TaxID=3364491 RepID=UPI0038080C9C